MLARMAGFYLRSEYQRMHGRDAGNVFKRAVGGSLDGLPPAPFKLAILSAVLLVNIAKADQVVGGAQQPTMSVAPKAANSAGRVLTPPSRFYQKQSDDSPPTAEELAAARGLEQLLLDMMMQEMRKTVPENDIVPVSQGERIFRQMLDQEYTRQMSESGGVGVAELVLAQMRGKR